ncbi:MAG: sortase [Lachnospiraceae bacterium]|nr:sortase [Lachnospiraceae bacterium]
MKNHRNENRKVIRKKFGRTGSLTALLILSLLLFCFCLYHVLDPEPEGRKRQETEESLAREFLKMYGLSPDDPASAASFQADGSSREDITSGDMGFPDSGTGGSSRPGLYTKAPLMEIDEPDLTGLPSPYTDWFTDRGITYTPDYARGKIMGVLQIPAIDISRGVYGGSWEDIRHDLSIWMITSARPDYIPGETHFVIYGHYHEVQNLSFNRLHELKTGDSFTFTTKRETISCVIHRIYALSREEVRDQITDNFSLPAGRIYLVTCGKGKDKGLDLVIEGRRVSPNEG